MPRRMSLSLMRVLMLTLLLGPVAALDGLAQDATPGVPPELAWTACDGASDWECARLPVPIDYANPSGASIDLAVTRLPAGDPAKRIGTLLFNCGGPGCPAVRFLHQVGALLFSDAVRARFGLIGFDARGVGESAPLDCQIGWESYLALDPSPDDAAERENWLAGGRDYAAACAINGGALLPFVGTENVVSDMERLREALGEETISFLGLSYGTSLGARYADRYPDRVRAFALDSGLPSFVDPQTFVAEWVDGIERSFDAFLAGCASTPSCPFYSGGNPGAAFDALMVELDAATLAVATDSGTRQIGQRAVLDAVDITLSQPARWPELASALAAMSRGDGTTVLALADQRNERAPDGAYYPGAEVFLAVSCLESACVEEAINTYLLDLTLPRSDLICASTGGLRERFG